MKTKFTEINTHGSEKFGSGSTHRIDKRGLSYYLPIVLLITLFVVIIAEISNG